MQKKSWLFIGMIGCFILACAFVLRSSSTTPTPAVDMPVENPAGCATCCKEGDPACSDAEKTKNAGDMLPESRARQFIFITPSAY
ncbi:MAG: hypothetical protein JNM88_09185 [Chitinophagaceae bacterium]|nr:hypothetical protein [Chitinophagaceae bacterium]